MMLNRVLAGPWAGGSPPVANTGESRPSFLSQNDDLPAVRPNLPLALDQPDRGPYILDDATRDIAIPSPLNRYLKEYQRVGAQFLYRNYTAGRGGILGDDMG
jgi:SNF2 family DNA or RNA helicase